MQKSNCEKSQKLEMKERRILLADGRYLIFYSFEEPLTIDDKNADKLTTPQEDPERLNV
jgi:hypothetical protein